MTLPIGAASDTYGRILAQIAPNAARLKESYNGHLARALLVAVNLHLLGLGAYWVATYVAAVNAEPVVVRTGGDGPTLVNPPIVEPPSTPPGRPLPPSTPSVAGVPTPVPDDEADPDATTTPNDDPLSDPGPVGPTEGGQTNVGPIGPGPGTFIPPDPSRPPSGPPVLDPKPGPEPDPGPPSVFDVVEIQPTLIGGIAALQERVEYPTFDRNAGISGRVTVQFVVDENGAPSQVVALRAPSPGLGRAAVEAVQRSRFTPGIQNGRAVKVRFTLPVTFRLN